MDELNLNAEIAAVQFPDNWTDIGNWMSEDYSRAMLNIYLEHRILYHITLDESALICLKCVRKWGRILCPCCSPTILAHRIHGRNARYRLWLQSLAWNEFNRETTPIRYGSEWQTALIKNEEERRTLLRPSTTPGEYLLRPAPTSVTRTDNLLHSV